MFGYKKMYINGELCDSVSGQKEAVYCPATDTVIGEIARANTGDSMAALESASRACKSWSCAPIQKRVEYMLKLRGLVVEHQELLREAEMHEHGKTWAQTEEGYLSVINSLEYYAMEIQRMHGHVLVDKDGDFEHKIVYRGAGVAAAFLAWNFPLLNLAFKLGPAMAAGCPLIIRPSLETPLSAYIIGDLCARASLPAGVVNILTGPIAETADRITQSHIPAILTLIGSTATGREIMSKGSSSIKRYSMELGGNAPAIVFKDADLKLAARLISLLKFSNTGQICVAPNRIYVHEDIYDDFVSRVVEHASNIRIGHGRNSGADMGPMINKKARTRVDSWVKEAVQAGAQLHFGGAIPDAFPDSDSYYMPTVLSNVPESTRLGCDEVFGPVVSIMKPFSNYKKVMERANNTEAGLASYLFSKDLETVQKASRDLEFGEVQVNGVKYNIDLPHMGIKQSGVGMDCSHFALDDYMVKKRITISTAHG